ncbi:hypothetical protein [Kingella potus]|uniref:hypothetical protein n=1 Tax=Kingella potus TaxID=265175 RepID=UPI001FD421FD|nr:hypothetical protein [Kingella potus]UOP01438.1 hypothetical protein LVJ84_04315 [Kingella potus]
MKTLISTVSKIAVPNTLSVILFRFACLALSEPFYFGGICCRGQQPRIAAQWQYQGQGVWCFAGNWFCHAVL